MENMSNWESQIFQGFLAISIIFSQEAIFT